MTGGCFEEDKLSKKDVAASTAGDTLWFKFGIGCT
jgi:hypothetical protein